MNRILSTLTLTFVSALLLTPGAQALIVAAGGDGVIGPACFPSSIVWDDAASPASDFFVFGFNEQSNILLPGGTPVDISVPGNYEVPADLTPANLPPGCYVDVDYIHFLPVNPPQTANAWFTFANQIIGVVVEDATHDATNFLGCPATNYGTCVGDFCGMEMAMPDRIRVGLNSLQVQFDAQQFGDRIRVITLNDPTGACNALVD